MDHKTYIKSGQLHHWVSIHGVWLKSEDCVNAAKCGSCLTPPIHLIMEPYQISMNHLDINIAPLSILMGLNNAPVAVLQLVKQYAGDDEACWLVFCSDNGLE